MTERLDPGPFFCPVCGHCLRWTGRRHTRRTRAEIAAGIPVHVVHRRRLRAATFDCPVGIAEHRLDARLPPGHLPRTRHPGGEVSWRREHIAQRRTEFLPPGDAERTPWRFAARAPGSTADAGSATTLPVTPLVP
ncbi:MAG TPA: hypothetical protein VHG35_11095 [Gemmatimonadales bacterium]|nr:hypothetical protein [Gemmatimonadales bacterium]